MPRADDVPPRSFWKEWLPAITAVIAGAGVTLACGGYINQVKEHERRISALEARDQQLTNIDVRTARIEAKLEILTGNHEGPRQ